MANQFNSLFFFGRPFGPLYGLVMSVREQLYSKGVFRQENPGVPVVSVGNLVLGGTGKTPAVIHIAQLLIEHGYTPAIVSRGYRGRAKDNINVVSDGESILMDPVAAGDEPVLIAQSLAGTPVVTGKKRILPARYAVDHFGANIIILDDGFQHLGVSRDINLVLFDAGSLAGNSRIFPAGPLREPIAALKRTTAFLITGQTNDNKARSESFAELIGEKFPNIPVFRARNSRPLLTDTKAQVVSAETVEDAFVFCAIAHPERVRSSVESIGIHIVGSRTYEDHSPYTQKTITSLCGQAAQAKAKYLITTSKDFVKIENFHFTLPLLVLQIKQEPEPTFNEYILQNITHRR